LGIVNGGLDGKDSRPDESDGGRWELANGIVGEEAAVAVVGGGEVAVSESSVVLAEDG
jgi:hypothetical protein